MLRRAASLIAMLLLLLTTAPVMACVTDQQMTQSNACCQMMHGKCGEMAKTGCCRVEVRDQEPQVAAHSPVLSFHRVAIAVMYFHLPVPQTGLPARWLAPDEHSPPLPRSTRPTVLRI